MKVKPAIRIVLFSALILLLGAFLYIYRQYNRKQTDLSKAEAAYIVTSDDLVKEFADNEKEASAKYISRVLQINGNVKQVDKDEHGFPTIVIGAASGLASIRCSMDSVWAKAASQTPSPGMSIIVKGICTGYLNDELLGSDVILNRCIVQ